MKYFPRLNLSSILLALSGWAFKKFTVNIQLDKIRLNIMLIFLKYYCNRYESIGLRRQTI